MNEDRCLTNYFFEESELNRNFNFYELSPSLSDLSAFYSEQDKQVQVQLKKQSKKKNPCRITKIEKSSKIRTSRNVQKIYHNILKHWLEDQRYDAILPKYNSFFNQRVYFILVLDEIIKKIDGEVFAASYEDLAREVIAKKHSQINFIQKAKQDSQQSKHLRRVMQEIEFSIKACKEFISGNVLDSLLTVYKRNQGKITKMKEFEKAMKTYKEVTGHKPYNF